MNALIELRNNPHVANDSTFRHWLHREVKRGGGWKGLLAVVMLNPSTADESHDDPTIRRVVSFAEREGYADVLVVNLIAKRATDPWDMQRCIEKWGLARTIGHNNDIAQAIVLEHANEVLLAWGAHPTAALAMPQLVRALRFRGENLPPLVCLGRTKSGVPRHPLYIRGTTPFQPITLEEVERMYE